MSSFRRKERYLIPIFSCQEQFIYIIIHSNSKMVVTDLNLVTDLKLRTNFSTLAISMGFMIPRDLNPNLVFDQLTKFGMIRYLVPSSSVERGHDEEADSSERSDEKLLRSHESSRNILPRKFESIQSASVSKRRKSNAAKNQP